MKPVLVPLDEALITGDAERLALSADLPHGEPWGWALARALLSAEALAPKLVAEPAGLIALVEAELERLREHWRRLKEERPVADLGRRPAHEAEWAALRVLEGGSAHDLAALYREHGWAPFACHRAALWREGFDPVPHPASANLDEIVGYESQRARLVALAKRFLAGKPLPPTLLAGARGSGKSTLVRGLVTAFGDEGLRIVEPDLAAMAEPKELFEALRERKKRFLLFLDDLAFDTGDERVRRWKRVLEGSLVARPENVWVVATSNRRNLVRERWEDREEPNAWETAEEIGALADRFGVVILFPPMDQAAYLRAVAHHLGRPLTPKEREAALRFANQGRGFSGRTAKTFAELFTLGLA